MSSHFLKACLICLCVALSACASKETGIGNPQPEQNVATTQTTEQQATQTNLSTWQISTDSAWYPLYTRLRSDGFQKSEIDNYFIQLENNFSPVPMGTKITELYNISFKPKQKPTAPPKVDTNTEGTGVPKPWYKGFVEQKNAQKCRDFITENQAAFDRAQKMFHISPDVVAALMYVETKHGSYLGVHNPIVNLASMSTSTKISQIPEYLEKLPLAKEKEEWILGKMKEKSDWAYIELKALIKYCNENALDPFTLPSSVYGALGYGQFMPTNIPRYAIDGDDDDIINLFNPADAILSTANYLSKHGWKNDNMTLQEKLKVIKRYNYSTTYANTIMALSVLTRRTK